jgi:ribosome-associated heat shock protein Hsp15
VSEGIRIDKWLWAVRVFKTRSIAADYCKKGKVFIDDIPVKPSRLVHLGEIIRIKKPPVEYSYKVCGLISKRVGAALANNHVEDITPENELIKLKSLQESAFFNRERGTGRPTKKDRRDLDKLKL